MVSPSSTLPTPINDWLRDLSHRGEELVHVAAPEERRVLHTDWMVEIVSAKGGWRRLPLKEALPVGAYQPYTMPGPGSERTWWWRHQLRKLVREGAAAQ